MKTRGVFRFIWILLVSLALCSACTTVAERSAGTGPVLRGSLGRGRVRSIRMQLSHAETRIRELEAKLAEPPPAASGTSAANASERESQLAAELEQAKQESQALRDELADARAAADAAIAAADRPGASPEIASLQVELDGERSRRRDAEEQLTKMREETSGSPFESSASAPLQEARREIENLTNQLTKERNERDELEKRFAELKVQLQQEPTVDVVAAPADPEMAELQEDQRRLMAAIQQDLEASRRREAELRQTISTLQGEGGTQLTAQVQNLEAENVALQSSLDAEHERNVELAAKLEVATRVADMIFRMRREGRIPSGEGLDAPAPE